MFLKKLRFLEKLWIAVNKEEEDGIFQWNEDGTKFLIDEDRFYKVCYYYPGLIRSNCKVSMFRSLRDYGFHTRVHVSDSGRTVRECWHPHFRRDNPDLLFITKRRDVRSSKDAKPGKEKEVSQLDGSHTVPSLGARQVQEGASTAVKETTQKTHLKTTSESKRPISHGQESVLRDTHYEESSKHVKKGKDQRQSNKLTRMEHDQAFKRPPYASQKARYCGEKTRPTDNGHQDRQGLYRPELPVDQMVMVPFVLTPHGYVPMDGQPGHAIAGNPWITNNGTVPLQPMPRGDHHKYGYPRLPFTRSRPKTDQSGDSTICHSQDTSREHRDNTRLDGINQGEVSTRDVPLCRSESADSLTDGDSMFATASVVPRIFGTKRKGHQ